MSSIPAIATTNSPAPVTLLDPSALIYSDSSQFEIDASQNAPLELNDNPANPTVAGTIMSSMYGRNDVAIRALRWVSWLNPSPTTTAAFMTVAY